MFGRVGRLSRLTGLITVISMVFCLFPGNWLLADSSDYDIYPLSVSYTENSSWNNSVQAQFTITNVSTYDISEWTINLSFDQVVDITNIWCAEDVTGGSSDILTITSDTLIPAGQTYTFGYIAEGANTSPVAPDSVDLVSFTDNNNEIEEPEIVGFPFAVFSGSTTSDLTISGWQTNIIGDIYSGNDFVYQGSELYVDGYAYTAGSVDPSSWILSMIGACEDIAPIEIPDYSEDIVPKEGIGYICSETDITLDLLDITEATYIVAEGNIVYNSDSITGNGIIVLYSKHGDITITGSNAQIEGIIYAPEGCININAGTAYISGRLIADSINCTGSVLTVVSDENDLDIVTDGVISTITDTPLPTLTDTPVPTITAEPSETITPTTLPIDPDLDSDEDGIPDYIETEIGTDPEDEDTDNDGIEDLLEILIGYDPTEQDTDGDGILDGDEDLDGDGLSNLTELSLGTEIISEDTDCDGLTDGDEINIYGTDPLDYDTDDDGISDGDELLLGKDPADPSDGTVTIEQTYIKDINNADDGFITSVEVTTELSGLIDNVLNVRDIYNVDVYVTDYVGRMGSPIDIDCEEEISSATLVFYYDENELGTTNESDLGVLWFDEDTGLFELQDQAIVDESNNKIVVELSHFSKYLVVDKTIRNSSTPIASQNTGPFGSGNDVVVVINVTDSMSETERDRAYTVVENYISHMNYLDGISVVLYASNNVWSNSPMYDVDSDFTAQSILDYLDDRLYNAYSSNTSPTMGGMISAANEVFDNYLDVGNERLVLIISDDNILSVGGAANNTRDNLELTPYSVSVSENGEVANCMQRVPENNSGLFFEDWSSTNIGHFIYSNQSRLDKLRERNIEKDEDSDGLPDYMEIYGMMGANHKIYYSDPGTQYSDDDGYTDSEEMGQMVKITARRQNGDLVYEFEPDYPMFQSKLSDFLPDYECVVYVFLIKSDPMINDTDGDFYYDDEDPYPMSNGLITIGLGGESYDIREPDPGYIHVSGAPTEPYYAYGGRQGWFENEPFTSKYDINNTGCGLIAANDVILYLENGTQDYDWSVYHDEVLETYEDLVEAQVLFGHNLPVGFATSISPSYVQECLAINGYASWLYDIDIADNDLMLQKIEESLNDDKPVILMEDDRLAYYDKKDVFFDRDGVAMYVLNNEASRVDQLISIDPYNNTMIFHYVTITGLIRHENSNECYLRVQSWGKEYYINYSEFVEYNEDQDDRNGYLLFIL